MILYFPQWQGIGFPTNVTEGARRIYDMLTDKKNCQTVPVTPKHELSIEHGVYGHQEIVQQLKNALDILDAEKPARVLTIGGDCGVEVTPTSYLNDLYAGDLQIFWFDAHADINTPDTSFSGHFHGMPLGYLLGEVNDDPLTPLIKRKISPEQIAFIGLRSIDPPEEDYIASNNIQCLTFDSLRTMPKKYNHAILHVDTDVLDARLYNECSTPTMGGTDSSTLIAALQYIFENYNVVGGTITEYAPGTKDNKKADVSWPIIRDIFINGLKANDKFWI